MVLADLPEIPAAVGGVAIQAGTDQHVILDHQLLVDAADGVGKGDGFGAFAAHLFANPSELLAAQQKAASDWMKLWTNAAARAAGAEAEPVIAPERGDRRFKDPAWDEEPVFDYLKQAYLLTARRAAELIQGAEGLDEATRTKVDFFTQQ